MTSTGPIEEGLGLGSRGLEELAARQITDVNGTTFHRPHAHIGSTESEQTNLSRRYRAPEVGLEGHKLALSHTHLAVEPWHTRTTADGTQDVSRRDGRPLAEVELEVT
jgi:hypothetical protein